MARKQWLSVGELTHEGFTNKDAVVCYTKDTSENVTKCSKAGTPPSATTGYAVGCEFTNTSTGEKYVNTGSATSCTFTSMAVVGLTASAAELNYLDITTLGTGAASKAVVLDASGNYIMPSAGLFGMSRGTLAAAGSGASDAAVITQQVTAVTGSNGTLAVALPAAATATGPLLVINTVLTTGATLPVFPVNGGNDNINGGAEDAAFTMGPGRAAWFIPTSATQWYVADASGATSTKAEASILTGVTATAAELNYNDIAALGTGAASKSVVLDGSGNYTWPAAGILTHSGRVFCNTAPVDYTHSSLSVGVYGTPVVDTAVVDNIAFAVNMSTATNKTVADTSCMAAFIGVSNTAAVTNNKMQALLASTTLAYNCYDAYAVQGHVAVTGNMGTQNANAHITGISGKANIASTKTVATGWVTGGLFIVEGAGAVTQMCSVVSMVQEAGCSAAQTMCYINNDGTATKGLDYVGNFTTGIDMTPTTLTTGIAIDAGFTNGITITNATLGVTDSRAIKVSTSQAAPAMADGYGVVEIDHSITGTAASNFSGCALSSWVNIPSGTVGSGVYVCAQNNGVYEASAATITGAKIVFGMRCQKLLDDTDATSFPFSINTNNTAITALIDVNNATDMGWVDGVLSSATGDGHIPLFRDAAGVVHYINTYVS